MVSLSTRLECKFDRVLYGVICNMKPYEYAGKLETMLKDLGIAPVDTSGWTTEQFKKEMKSHCELWRELKKDQSSAYLKQKVRRGAVDDISKRSQVGNEVKGAPGIVSDGALASVDEDEDMVYHC